jgi:outer membrane protein TolC
MLLRKKRCKACKVSEEGLTTMRLLVKLAWCASLLATAAYCHAQISLSSAVDLAERNDPRVKLAQSDVAHARAAVDESHDAYVPSSTVSGGDGASTGVPLSVPVIFSIAAQSLVFSFSQRDNVRAAEAAFAAAQLSLKEAQEQVAEDVAITYLDLANTQQRQLALEQQYGFASRLVAIVQDRLSAGQDNNMDLLKAKLTAAQIHYQKLKADDDVASLSDHLARIIGLPGNHLTPVSSSIPPLPLPSSIEYGTQESPGIRALFATAHGKQEFAFGENRYRLRPRVSFGANYSRIHTNQTNYAQYYPAFASANHLSYNDLSVGIEIDIPLFDMGHQARAREAQADARHALYDAQNQENVFFEGRLKLRHSIDELSDQAEIAADNQGIAQEELNAVLAQLSANNAANGRPPLTPKDEQNARVAERARYLDLLTAQFGAQQAEVNLLRQTGQLDSWLRQNPSQPQPTLSVPISH